MGDQLVDAAADDEPVLRFIPATHFANGQVLIANLKSNDPRPSAFLLSRCTLEQLERENPAWSAYGYAVVSVGDLRALDVKVELTPSECSYEPVRHAHVALLNIHKHRNRDRVIDLFTAKLRRPPKK